MYLLIALLRRMARPRRYRNVSVITENDTKMKAISPRTMPVVACLLAEMKGFNS